MSPATSCFLFIETRLECSPLSLHPADALGTRTSVAYVFSSHHAYLNGRSRTLCSLQHFSYWGKATVHALHIPRGTWLSSQVQVYTAFLLSALIHSFGDLMLGTQHFGRSFPFFLANAAAITFEDSLIAFGKSLGIGKDGPTRATRLLGYVWVVLWVRFSAPMYVDWMFESGVVANPVLAFSPTRSLVVPWLWVALRVSACDDADTFCSQRAFESAPL